ncbi:MAG: hypothetical protein D6729_05160 [Deltaproteobacteria bacterium]|nr:MAG: hypothetical protein D6729_05160 [Deltaproteobacteria bacterium]
MLRPQLQLSRRRTFLLLCLGVCLAALGFGCGPGGEGGFDGGPSTGTCMVQPDCWANDGDLPYEEVCIEGKCYDAAPRRPDGSLASSGWSVIANYRDLVDLRPEEVVSAAVRFYARERTDGSSVDCGTLLRVAAAIDEDLGMNIVRKAEPRLNLAAGSQQTLMGMGDIPAGSGRLLLVRFHAEARGEGTLLAKGCVDGLEIPDDGEEHQVVVDMALP